MGDSEGVGSLVLDDESAGVVKEGLAGSG